MVWIRRLLALLVVALALGGFWYVRQYSRAAEQAHRARLALLSARIWVATAEYRDRPAAFLVWRDSLLTADNLSADSLRSLIDRYRDDPLAYEDYTRLVSYYVDSIVQSRTAPLDTTAPPRDTAGVRVRRE